MTLVKKTKHNRQGIVPLALIGVLASFVFAFNAVAAGMVPGEVVALANAARAKANLSALRENNLLSQAAENKANDMIKNDYFAHTSPKGVEPWYWIKGVGYQYKAAGENLAINYTDAKEQHAAWMGSETHRANIMSSRYQDIGVAVVKGKINGKESIVTVEFFGSPLVAAADAVTPIPPEAPVVAEIKGMETESAPVMTENLPPVTVFTVSEPEAKVVPTQVIVPLVDTTSLWLVRIGILALLLVVTPIAFFLRAFGTFKEEKRTEGVAQAPASNQKAIKTGTFEPTTLTVDGIHKVMAH